MASRAFTFGALVQYVLLGVAGYILAGAPLLSILRPATTSEGAGRATMGGNGVQVSREKLESLVVPSANLNCSEHAFRGVYVLSREPLVVYIEGFLSEEEAKHVVEVRYVRSRAGLILYLSFHRSFRPAAISHIPTELMRA